MINNPAALILSTRYNLQKIYAEGTTVVNVVNSIPPFDPVYDYVIYTHNLGYIPTARVFYVPVTNQLWPISNSQFSKADGGTGTLLEIFGNAFLTTTELKVRLRNVGLDRNVTFYYRIYVDE